MLSHLLDHFVFSSRRFSHQTKSIFFGFCAFLIVGTFWWFRGLAFGVDGPINDQHGLQWRKVRDHRRSLFASFLIMNVRIQSWNIYL